MSRNTVRAIQFSDRWDLALVDQVKKGLSAGWYLTAERSLERITDQKLDNSSAVQLGTLAAISTDKARLIEGLATERREYADKSDVEIESEIVRLEEELKALEAGRAVDADITPVDTSRCNPPA